MDETSPAYPQLLLLRAAFFIYAISYCALNYWLIIYFYDYFNIFECNILFGCWLGLQFFMSIIWGYLADYFSNKKLTFFIIGYIISALVLSILLYQPIIKIFNVAMIILLIKSLLETITVLIVPANTYGQTKFWFAIGHGFGDVLIGISSHFVSSHMTYIYFYDITVILMCGILVIGVIVKKRLNIKHSYQRANDMQNDMKDDMTEIEIDDTTEDMTVDVIEKSAKELMIEFITITYKNAIVIIFFTDLFIFGIAHCFVRQSLYIYLLNAFNAKQYLCGLIGISMTFGELIIFHNCSYLLQKIGINGLILLSHWSYAFRVIIYTLIPHYESYTYLFLLIEPLHGFTYAGRWIACIEYASRISPIYLKATMIGSVYGIYTGLANMCGAFMAGYIYYNFGPDIMFRSAGIIILIWSILYQVSFRFLHHLNPDKFTKAMV